MTFSKSGMSQGIVASSQENFKQSGNFVFSIQKVYERVGKGNIVSNILVNEFMSQASLPALSLKDMSWMISEK